MSSVFKGGSLKLSLMVDDDHEILVIVVVFETGLSSSPMSFWIITPINSGLSANKSAPTFQLTDCTH
jgi:hypothetical protein